MHVVITQPTHTIRFARSGANNPKPGANYQLALNAVDKYLDDLTQKRTRQKQVYHHWYRQQVKAAMMDWLAHMTQKWGLPRAIIG
jgi:hypothetical protein